MMGPMPITRREIRERGVDLRKGHADIPPCAPTRTSSLTGLSITTHGCDTNRTYRGLQGEGLGGEDRGSLLEAGQLRHRPLRKYTHGHASDDTVFPYCYSWCETKVNGNGSGENLDSSNRANVAETWTAGRE